MMPLDSRCVSIASMMRCFVVGSTCGNMLQARELQSQSGGKGLRPGGGEPWYQLKSRRVGS